MLLIFWFTIKCVLICVLINLSMVTCKNEESVVRMFETLLTALTDDSKNLLTGTHLQISGVKAATGS
jgi:ribosomal protein S3AE